MRELSVTLIQSRLYWEDIAANLKMFSDKISTVQNTNLIVLPETFSTGFSINPQLAETMNGSAVNWMKKTAREKNCVVSGSLIIQDNGKYYNRFVWMQPNGEIQTYDKRHLFSISDEPAFFTAGNQQLIISLNGWKICPQVCYDLRFPVWARNTTNGNSPAYDLLLYVANWPNKRRKAWTILLPARAIENQCYVIGVNRTGDDGKKITHTGDSMAVDALGKILYHKKKAEDIFTIKLSYDKLLKVRKQFPFLDDADNFITHTKQKIKSH